MPVIGSIGNVFGYLTLAGAGLTGLSGDPNANSAPDSNSSRLLDGAGATLQALDNGRNGVDQIKAALVQLRNTLQAARAEANAVPGRTELQPIIADVEQTRDKPTYVTVNGVPQQTGTITVSLGTRPLIVGYESANRAPLAVGDAVKSLASTVATLVSSVGGNDGFAAAVSSLLQSSDFTTAVNAPDATAIDAAIGQIDKTLAKADGLQSSISASASSAAQVNLGGLLLGATANAGADLTGSTGTAGISAYQSNSTNTTGTQLSSWA